ncbi:hypothetical protein AVHY2522_20675 [Acidovorax sp. SUPP2522]|uniref:hypothetical protein n=1 Tax=unclassified Acidovorax TaxID=2684926 RepID=UPI00234A3EBE|nr:MULTISPECIES: hypothetical protein [unclassified Acidovorax]WCM98261.1 hypothetical protein M5C96_01970 [Acidovorax sp. GBBC 1281]GKT18940.1 hypothetical protein AVHY2522_20675 [Acidovorax sp. SUPP2522]
MNEIEENQIREACDAILESDAFAKAHRMKRLFRFLVEQAVAGENRNTNEHTIGIEVFDREASAYMPGEDPIGNLSKPIRSLVDRECVLHPLP